MSSSQPHATPAPHAPSAAPDMVSHATTVGDTFRRDYPLLWSATLFGPFLLTAALLVYLGLTRPDGWTFVGKLAGTAIVTFFGLGRFVILFGSDTPKTEIASSFSEVSHQIAEEVRQFNFLTRLELFTMVSWMDLLAATILIFHMGFIFGIPKIGPNLAKLREEGEFFMHTQPWMRRFTFIGLVAFVVIPVAATGSVGGAIFGRLLGMSRRLTFAAIVCGTLIGNGTMLVAGKAIAKIPFLDPHKPTTLILGLGIVVAIILLLNWRYSKMKKKWQGDRAMK